jgi:hypothetical protein
MVFIADSVPASDVHLQDRVLLRRDPGTRGGNVLCFDALREFPDAR